MRLRRTEHKLESRIETFLSRKFKEFPELDESEGGIASLANSPDRSF